VPAVLNELKKQFQLAFEKISDPLLLVDAAGYILDFNPAARERLDIGESEHIKDVTSPEKSFVFDGDAMLSLLARSDSVHGVRLNDDEGNPSDVVVDVLKLDIRKDKPAAKLIHVKDFSSFKSYERWKDELVSMVAHEIKNPLSAMKNSMSILISQATGPVTDEQNKLLTTSIRGIDRLTRLLDGFLDMSRIGAGKYTLEPRWINAREFFPDVIDSFKTLFNVQRQTLSCRISDEVDTLFADAPKLEQVLINLLSNAVKFTPSGGDITVSVEPASLEALREGLRVLNWREVANLKFLRITVKDTGIGMTGETVSHLFTRYYQKGDGGGLKGSHLGLSISKALTEVQYGSLGIESEPGVGTEVTVHLPEDENTILILSRIASMERRLARAVDARKECVFCVVQKSDDARWSDITDGWDPKPVINPSTELEKSVAFAAWTFGDHVAALLSLDEEGVSSVVRESANRVAGEPAVPGTGRYTVGLCRVPADGTRFGQLLKQGLNRSKEPSPVWSKV
jgi:signal transduction histidine kinase